MDNQKNKSIKLIVFFLFGWAIITLLVWNFRSLQFDDAYITYRYARNISAGLGFSYNPPQLVLGTTTPLYTLLLSLFSWLGLDIPTISLVLSWLGLAGTTWILLVASSDDNRTINSILPAFFLILIPGSYLILGMETAFFTALIHFSIYLVYQKKFTAAIIFASTATLTRYEGIIVAGLVLMAEWYLTRSKPIKNGLIFMVLLFPWIVYATLTFDSALPNTFYAKTGDFGANAFIHEFGLQMAGLFAFSQVDIIGGYIILIMIIVLLAWCLLVTRDIFTRLTVSWGALYLVVYSLLGIRYSFHWYYYPAIPAILLSMNTSLRWLQTRFKKTSIGNFLVVSHAPLLFISLPMFTLVTRGTITLNQQYEILASLGGRNNIYPLAADWVCAHSNPEATILTPEIGIIGWNCDRKIIDPYGLVTPDMIPFVQGGERLVGEARMHPDFIIIPNVALDETKPTVPGAEIFQDVYLPVKIFSNDLYPYQLVIFSKTQ